MSIATTEGSCAANLGTVAIDPIRTLVAGRKPAIPTTSTSMTNAPFPPDLVRPNNQCTPLVLGFKIEHPPWCLYVIT
jgi:hypothetical protein